jgi:hypothetical protein
MIIALADGGLGAHPPSFALCLESGAYELARLGPLIRMHAPPRRHGISLDRHIWADGHEYNSTLCSGAYQRGRALRRG